MTAEAKPVRAVIAVRVSSVKQIRGTSLAEQERACRAEAALLGWEVVRVVADKGKSGSDWDREGLQEMLDLFRSGEADAALVDHQDRLARTEYVRVQAEYEMQQLGIRYRPLNLPASVDPFDESEGEMTAGVFGVLAQYQRRQNQWKAARGQRAKAAEGRWPTGSAPYGWHTVGKGKQIALEADPHEREVIALAVRTMLEGGTTGECAQVLNAAGYRTRSGLVFDPRRVLFMLRKTALVGYTMWGSETSKTRGGKRARKNADGTFKYGEPIRLALPDPPLDEPTWDALQRALDNRSYGTKKRGAIYPLAQRADTPCGGQLGGVLNRQTRQYRCSNRRWVSDPDYTPCSCSRIDAEWLEQRVWLAVRDVLANPGRLLALAAEYLSERAESAQTEGASLARLDADIARMQANKVSKVAEYLAAGIDAATVAAATARLDQDIEAKKQARDRLADQAATDRAEGQRAEDLAKWARVSRRMAKMTLEERAEVLALLRVRVTVQDDTPRPAVRVEGVVPGGRVLELEQDRDQDAYPAGWR